MTHHTNDGTSKMKTKKTKKWNQERGGSEREIIIDEKSEKRAKINET